MALIIPFFIQHRGCAHRCLFCNQWAIGDENRKPLADSGDELKKTIELWLSRSNLQSETQVAFFGGSFTCLDETLQEQFLRTVEPFIQRGFVTSVRLSTRPDCISAELCEFLADYGVKTVELGVQSMDDAVLCRSERGHSVDDTQRAAGLLSDHGFELGLQLMPGLPGESTRSFISGVHEVVSLRPDFVRLYPVLVIKQTGLADLYRTTTWNPLSMNKAITLTRRARELLMANGIRVIRMGLQPSEELEKQLIAGPYHPAFGELVIGRGWYLRARRLLAAAGFGKTVTMTICDRDYSAFVGPQKQNLKRLQELPYGSRLMLETDKTLEREQFRYVVS